MTLVPVLRLFTTLGINGTFLAIWLADTGFGLPFAIYLLQGMALGVIGAVFVAVTLSVILQVGSFRLRGRRIFRMAPLQHHFELIGWAEEKITVRFWIVSALAGLLGFSLFLATVNGL